MGHYRYGSSILGVVIPNVPCNEARRVPYILIDSTVTTPTIIPSGAVIRLWVNVIPAVIVRVVKS